MTSPQTEVHEPAPLLVGRDDELARVRGVLGDGSAGLVLVAVHAGLGQTTFLRAVAAAAREQRYAVVVNDEHGEISVTHATTPDSFTARLRGSLGIPPYEALVSVSGEFESSPARRDRVMLSDGSSVSSVPTSGVREPLIDQLRRLPSRPVVLIDGYRPSKRFGVWFRDTFVADLRRVGNPAVVVLADVPEALRPLASMPHVSVELGDLRRPHVLGFFQELSHTADPPLTSEEIEIFTDESVSQPELLAALHNLLALPTDSARGSQTTMSTESSG
jgi:hypothetical protein